MNYCDRFSKRGEVLIHQAAVSILLGLKSKESSEMISLTCRKSNFPEAPIIAAEQLIGADRLMFCSLKVLSVIWFWSSVNWGGLLARDRF